VCGVGVGGEAEGAGVGEAGEVGPGCGGGEAEEGEDLLRYVSGGVKGLG